MKFWVLYTFSAKSTDTYSIKAIGPQTGTLRDSKQMFPQWHRCHSKVPLCLPVSKYTETELCVAQVPSDLLLLVNVTCSTKLLRNSFSQCIVLRRYSLANLERSFTTIQSITPSCTITTGSCC